MSFLPSTSLASVASNQDAQQILNVVHFSSPIILIIFFLTAFTAQSIATASTDHPNNPHDEQTGPGGKPLPSSKKKPKERNTLDFSPARKLLFNWLSVGTCTTFVANAAVVILHALVDRKDHWWCGEAVAVCYHWFPIKYGRS